MNDEDLIEAFCNGQKDAFNELVEQWQPRIHRVAYRYFNSHDEAMDIAQKTFIKAYKKLHTLDDAEAFPSWIYRIAHNLCLDETRRAGRRRSVPLEIVNHQSANRSTDQPLHQKELGSILQQGLQKLPPEQRIVVIMKEYEELKFTEIADALGIPESTAKSRLYTGFRKLNEIFNQWNINKEDLYYE